MNSSEFCRLAERILRKSTAPYFEEGVRSEAERICEENGLHHEFDAFGNLHVRLQTDPRQRPLVLAAHMDHPGFEVVRRISRRTWLLQFRGGVGREYFRTGTLVRLMPGRVKARIIAAPNPKALVFKVEANNEETGHFSYAVWDLKDFELHRGRIRARACDDLIGVSAVLATCIELKRRRVRVNLVGALSRAEEVGFHGALALADASARSATSGRTRPKRTHNPLLRRDSLVISLETSRELPGVRMGSGVIIRTGDRASIFHSQATRFLTEVATDLGQRDKTFRFQRALMSGGTCEATAYQEFGFDSAAVCIALGNYHNCGPNSRIACEYVDVGDACAMVNLLTATAQRLKDYERLTGRLDVRLQKLLREAKKRLKQ